MGIFSRLGLAIYAWLIKRPYHRGFCEDCFETVGQAQAKVGELLGSRLYLIAVIICESA